MNTFRTSKANRYRQVVSKQCKEKKQQLLQFCIIQNGMFLCNKCNTFRKLEYCRLGHIIPLKTLWNDFEKLYTWPSEISKESSHMVLWKLYHQKEAVLDILCKDCETKN